MLVPLPFFSLRVQAYSRLGFGCRALAPLSSFEVEFCAQSARFGIPMSLDDDAKVVFHGFSCHMSQTCRKVRRNLRVGRLLGQSSGIAGIGFAKLPHTMGTLQRGYQPTQT